jgi:hypothetical protein
MFRKVTVSVNIKAKLYNFETKNSFPDKLLSPDRYFLLFEPKRYIFRDPYKWLGVKFHVFNVKFRVSNFIYWPLVLITGYQISYLDCSGVKLPWKMTPFYTELEILKLIGNSFCITNNTQAFICCWTNS